MYQSIANVKIKRDRHLSGIEDLKTLLVLTCSQNN